MDSQEPKKPIIPKPTNTQGSKRKKNKKLHYLRNFWLMNKNFLLSLIVIIVAIAGFLAYDQIKKAKAAKNKAAAEKVADVRKNQTEDKLEAFFAILNSRAALTNKAAQLDRLNKLIKLSKEILASEELDPSKRESVGLSALDFYPQRAATAFAYQDPSALDAEKEWIEFAQQEMNNPAEPNAMRARSNLSAYYIIAYIQDPNDERLEKARTQLRTSVPLLLKTQHDLIRLTSRIETLGERINSEGDEVTQLIDEMGNLYKTTGKETDWKFGSRIHDQLVLRGRDIETACNVLEFNGLGASKMVQTFMQELVQARRPSERLYSYLFSGLETFQRLDPETNLAGPLASVEQSIKTIESETLRKKMETKLARYQSRINELVGKQIDFSFLDSNPDFNSDGKPFTSSIKGKPMVILFGDNSERTRIVGSALRDFRTRPRNDKNEEYMYIETAIPEFDMLMPRVKPIDPRSFENLVRSSHGKTHVLLRSNAKKMLETIHVDVSPFVVVLDENHVVQATNVSPLHLEQHLKASKSAINQ